MTEGEGAMGDQADNKHVQAPIPSLAEEVCCDLLFEIVCRSLEMASNNLLQGCRPPQSLSILGVFVAIF